MIIIVGNNKIVKVDPVINFGSCQADFQGSET